MTSRPADYEILVHTLPEGWRRAAFIPYTVGWAIVSMIAEETQMAWGFPVRVVRGSECITEFGAPLQAAG